MMSPDPDDAATTLPERPEQAAPAAGSPPPPPRRFPWEPVVGVATLLSVALALWLAWSQSAQNRLSLTVQSSSSAIIARGLPSAVTVLVNGKEADQVSLTRMTVQNTGARPITVAMFSPGTDLRLHLGGACEIVQSSVERASPVGLRETVRLRPEKGGLRVAPLLLNKGATFTVQALTTGCLPNVVAAANIEGLDHVSMSAPRPSPWLSILLFACGLAGVVVSTLTDIYLSRRTMLHPEIRRVVVLVIFLGGVLPLILGVMSLLINSLSFH